MKYKLSTILLKMLPCDEARWWILNIMMFETFKEAVEACPNPRWLMWVLLHTESSAEPFSSELPNELWHRAGALRRVMPEAEHYVELKRLFLSTEYLERFAYAIIQYAKRHGVDPS